MKHHHYALTTKWTGNNGEGTSAYKSYERSYEVIINGKQIIKGSSDPSFLGDKKKHNPEELFLASISSCHMLWYLHLCTDAAVVVTDYIDYATGTMVETINGGGKFEEVILNPVVTVKEFSMKDNAKLLHNKAHEHCFIANSLNFNVSHKASIIVA
jgi:organic hydroperoxide reductase OsmC/OhrA